MTFSTVKLLCVISVSYTHLCQPTKMESFPHPVSCLQSLVNTGFSASFSLLFMVCLLYTYSGYGRKLRISSPSEFVIVPMVVSLSLIHIYPEEVKYELSDFLYHAIVLMVERGVTWEDIIKELADR